MACEILPFIDVCVRMVYRFLLQRNAALSEVSAGFVVSATQFQRKEHQAATQTESECPETKVCAAQNSEVSPQKQNKQKQKSSAALWNWGSSQSFCLNRSFPVFQWRCTESHPSTTWQSSPALAAARPPRAGAPQQCLTGARPWARTSRRSPAAKLRPGAEPRKPYLQQSMNPSRRRPLTSSSGLATTNHT